MERISDKFELDYRISQLREYADDKQCREDALAYLGFMVKDALADLQGPNLDMARRSGDLDDASGASHILRDYPWLAEEEIAAADLLLTLYLAIDEIRFDLGPRLLSLQMLDDIERKFNALLAWRLFSVKLATDRATDNRSRKQREVIRARNDSRGIQKRDEQIFTWYKDIVSTGAHRYMKMLQQRIAADGPAHGFSGNDLTLTDRQLRTIIGAQRVRTKKKAPFKKMRKSDL